MKIEDRIQEHEIARRKLNDKKDRIEEDLNRINEKIIYHTTAIMNLGIKGHKD